MKTLKIMTLALLSIALWSCKKDETRSVVNTSGASSALQSSKTSVVVDKSMLSSDVITFTLTPPDYGYKAGITNVIQLSTKADNFAAGKFREYTVAPNAKTVNYNGADFNTMLLALNLSTSANTDIVARLKSTISDDIAPIYSNVVSLSARPFPLTAWLYVPGAYQGWDPTTADSLVSVTGNGVYSGVITFTGADQEFKITPKKNGDNDYGDAGGGKLVAKGGNLKVTSAGPKLVTVNLNDMTYSIEDNKIWSLIGDATPGGWGGDTDMKTVNDGKNVWKVTANLGVGELKFRFGHDWGTNLGGALNALNPGGDNIKITTAGNYTLTLTVAYDSTGKLTGGTATIVKN